MTQQSLLARARHHKNPVLGKGVPHHTSASFGVSDTAYREQVAPLVTQAEPGCAG